MLECYLSMPSCPALSGIEFILGLRSGEHGTKASSGLALTIIGGINLIAATFSYTVSSDCEFLHFNWLSVAKYDDFNESLSRKIQSTLNLLKEDKNVAYLTYMVSSGREFISIRIVKFIDVACSIWCRVILDCTRCINFVIINISNVLMSRRSISRSRCIDFDIFVCLFGTWVQLMK